MSEETLPNELLHAVKLDFNQRDKLAELAFMRKAAAMGFAVAKPWGNSDRYDVIVRTGKVFWRVQVKFCLVETPATLHYGVRTAASHNSPYSADEIDFFAATFFPVDTWYILPSGRKRSVLCVRPGTEQSRLEPYREAWRLIGTD